MAKINFKQTIGPENTREQLLSVALALFSENGFEATSVREICEEAQANVSAIKYHFGSKEDLYRECFKHFGENRLSTISAILAKAQSRAEFKENITLYCHDFIESSLSNMAMTRMVMREIEAQNPLIEDIFQETFLKIFQTFTNAINQGKVYGFIREDIDTDIATSIFFHSISTSLRLDHVGKKHYSRTLENKEYRKLFVNNLVSIFFDGANKKEY